MNREFVPANIRFFNFICNHRTQDGLWPLLKINFLCSLKNKKDFTLT